MCCGANESFGLIFPSFIIFSSGGKSEEEKRKRENFHCSPREKLNLPTRKVIADETR
jgi:hypothetical protein